MKQVFKCANINCKEKTKEFKDDLFRDMFNELNKEGYDVRDSKVYCKCCSSEMIYVAYID